MSTLLYIFMVNTGHFEGKWGRYNYFGDSHPNLGSEIIAMSVIYAACVLSPIRLAAFSLVSIYAINFMQGRAGLIVCLLATVMGIFTRIENPRNRAALAAAVIFAFLLSLTVYHETTITYLNSILLLNDEHRGSDTGFVGRDELWGGAWDAFLQSPVIGNGAGFEERLDVNPHNFFLFGLALFGSLSIFVFGVIIYLYYELFKKNISWFSILIITTIMFVFNDRFFNLNPYPFFLYVALFAHAQDGPDQSAFRETPLERFREI
jgi:O-antigen ligase